MSAHIRGRTRMLLPLYCFVLFLIASAIMSCSAEDVARINNESTNNDEANVTDEFDDVTLTVRQMFNEEGRHFFEQLLAERYAHITVEWVDIGDVTHSVHEMEEVIASGNLPDVYIAVGDRDAHVIKELGLENDLTDLVNKFRFDLDFLDDPTMEGIRFLLDGGIWGLPETRGGGGPSVMLYNKDIFDQFGVPYPQDNMHWDEIIRLAADVTGEDNGAYYYGLAFYPEFLVTAISVGQPILDAQTDAPHLLDNPIWRRAFEAVDHIYSIPGMLEPGNPEEVYDAYNHWDGFGSGQVAMTNLYHPGTAVAWLEAGIHFDLVAGPTFQDGVKVPVNVSWTYLINPHSEHQEDAFRVIEVLLSKEMLIWRGNDMGDRQRLPTSDADVLSHVQLPDVLQHIHYDALFYHEAGPPVEKSPYESAMRGNMQGWFKQFVLGDQDEVEFLRALEDQINEQVQERRSIH